jgi:hypothetical protein
MEKTGSVDNRIANSVVSIANGRKALHTDGTEAMGRTNLHEGIVQAVIAFKVANTANDIKTIIQSELTFVCQERVYSKSVTVHRSLDAAKVGMNDALNSYRILSETDTYPNAEQTHPSSPRYRYRSLPKDAFHIACNSHITRLNNTLKSTEISPQIEGLYKQRIENLKKAKELYAELQSKALGVSFTSKKKDKGME